MVHKLPNDAIALLKADHRAVEHLFEQYESARKKDRKLAIAKKIGTALMVHTLIEEEIFYPACKEKIEEDALQEAYVEHDTAKVLIAEIEKSSPDNEFYDAKVKVLSELIKHHVGEEEARSEGMFAQARAAGLDIEKLGWRMRSRKVDLEAQFKSSGLAAPTTRSFTGHSLKEGAPVPDYEAAETILVKGVQLLTGLIHHPKGKRSSI